MKRSTKYYRKNEAIIMKQLGFSPTINSGAGWIQKEDGENDVALCQLKSTDAMSIKINQKDLRVLEEHAAVSHKKPVFAIQFLNTGEIWCMVRPEELKSLLSLLSLQSFCKKGVDKQTEMEYNNTINTKEGETDKDKNTDTLKQDLDRAKKARAERDKYRKELEEGYTQRRKRKR